MSNNKLNFTDVDIQTLKANGFMSTLSNSKTIFYDIITLYFSKITNIITSDITAGKFVDNKFIEENIIREKIFELYKNIKTDIVKLICAGYDLNASVYITDYQNSGYVKNIKYISAIPFYVEKFIGHLRFNYLFRTVFYNVGLFLTSFLIEVNQHFNVTEMFIFSGNSPMGIVCYLLNYLKNIANNLNNSNIVITDKCLISKSSINSEDDILLHHNFMVYIKLLDIFTCTHNFDKSCAMVEHKGTYTMLTLYNMLATLNKNDNEKQLLNYILKKIDLKNEMLGI